MALTSWENHRTQTQFEDALILKTFLFQFINSYFTLVRICYAFALLQITNERTLTMTHTLVLHCVLQGQVPTVSVRSPVSTGARDDMRTDVAVGLACVRTKAWTCARTTTASVPFSLSLSAQLTDILPVSGELRTQLLIIFSVKQLVLQAIEVLLPYVQFRVNAYLAARRVRQLEERGETVPPLPSQAEVESRKPAYESTFDDYNELAIQFGYVILFVAAFPLAPLLALASNFVEIRADAFKMLMVMQRPLLGRAETIGSWLSIFEVRAAW
jgi:hypothetical protein